jgi:hypothetical protein
MTSGKEHPKSSFDYTKWRASLWPDADVEQLSREAMKMREGSTPK